MHIVLEVNVNKGPRDRSDALYIVVLGNMLLDLETTMY